MLKKIKQNYHWLVALLVFLEMIVFGGLINSASVFTLPMSEELGVSTTAYAVATMPYTVTCFFGTSLTGILFNRFGYKKTALVSLVLTAVSLAIVALCNDLVVFAIGKVLFGIAYGTCFTAGSVRIIKDWFSKHVGLVLGAVSMASGLGGSLMTELLSAVIRSHSWRAANWVAAGIVAGIAVLYLLLKDRPEHIGLQPYGYGQTLKQVKKGRAQTQNWPGFDLSEQLRRPFFYLMCLCVVASCVCIYTTSSFVVPHFETQFKAHGLDPNAASALASRYQSIYMLMLAAAKLVLGALYDRFGSLPLVVGCMLCASAGQSLLAASTDPTVGLVGILLFAIGLCMTSIMIPLIAGSLFGYRGSAGVNGILLGLSSLSVLFSSPISSMSYDNYQSYAPVYRVTGILLLGILGLYLLLYALSRRERRIYATRHPDP